MGNYHLDITREPSNLSADRPATQVEITPEMIDAATKCLLDHFGDFLVPGSPLVRAAAEDLLRVSLRESLRASFVEDAEFLEHRQSDQQS